MKNLLNCHCIGLHSFPISIDESGLLKRIFYADTNHEMWKPVEIAIHPHHVDIKITVLEGELFNPIYELSNEGETFKKFLWNSHILNGKGGFEYIGEQHLKQISNNKYKSGETIIMKACELHTVQIEQGKTCAWLIEESKPSCDYFPINYSKNNLETWTSNGLYIECGDSVKQQYIGKFLDNNNARLISIMRNQETRLIAMIWWNDKHPLDRVDLQKKHFPERHYSSLTGREIENLWFQEVKLKGI